MKVGDNGEATARFEESQPESQRAKVGLSSWGEGSEPLTTTKGIWVSAVSCSNRVSGADYSAAQRFLGDRL